MTRVYKYILNGTAGVIVAESKEITQVITVERALTTDATNDAHDYTVVYPDGYAGNHNDDEIIQRVRNHERIVNDPAFFEFECCS